MTEIRQEHPDTDFELLFINDGSRDGTLSKLRELAKADSRVRYISFSRNFGKEAGMFAGLENASGDYVVVMDADLQHPPAFLPKMYNYVLSGEYDCATTRRVSRKGEPKLLSWFSRKFYKIMNKISQTEIVDGAQDFRFMTRQMVDSILSMREYNRFSKGIFSWVDFAQNTLSTRMWSVLPGRVHGRSGSCSAMRWRDSLHFPQRPLRSLLSSVSSAVCWHL